MTSENKRQSLNANKVPVALPKADNTPSTPTQLVTQDVSLQMAVGARIRVTTAAPTSSTIEGTVYTADPITNLLVINTTNSSATSTITPMALSAPAGAYRIIPISQVASFQLLTIPQTSSTLDSPVPPASSTLDTNALAARLAKSTAAAQNAQLRKGPKGTSAFDQALFDALSRTQPTRWQGTNMIISDVFVIEKPYEESTVKLLPGTNGDLERMKKVLGMERTKVGFKMPMLAGGAQKTGEGKGTPKKGG